MKKAEPTVFVIDDDEAVCDALQMLGETIDLKMQIYASGQKFLDEYEPGTPGCLLLDLRMPGMSGLQLQAELAKRHIRIPIILITGHGNDSETQRALEAGAMSVIQKPFCVEILIEQIQQAISRNNQILKGED